MCREINAASFGCYRIIGYKQTSAFNKYDYIFFVVVLVNSRQGIYISLLSETKLFCCIILLVTPLSLALIIFFSPSLLPVCLEINTNAWKSPAIGYCVLKTVDTIGNCQRLAFTVGVSQHMHKITNLWKFELNRSSKLRDNNERKITLVTRSCVRLDGWFRDLKF